MENILLFSGLGYDINNWKITKTNQDIVKKSAYLRYATKFN